MNRRGLLLLLASVFVIGVLNIALCQGSEPPKGDGTRVEEDIGKSKQGSKTDDETVAREEEAIKLDGINVADMKKLKEQAQKYQFQAEVDRMMKLIINSLYKNKDIFLRELISNSSDAIDKIRFLALTDKDAMSTNTDLKIMIKVDPKSRTLRITDTGVGMTREDLVKNLGTIAKSGTSEFFNKVSQSGSATEMTDLIGQFGVGFYSAFLVADEITVVSKNNADKQHIWTSDAQSFSVTEDPRGDTLKRGTEITLKLKEEAASFSEVDVIKDLIRKYSQFINFPIYLWTSKTETVTVPATTTPTEPKSEDDTTVEDEKPAEKEKTVEQTKWDWELMNESKPIWTRKPANVTEQEYNDFYRSFTKETQDPMARIHFSAEGEVTFKSILYVPATNDNELLTNAKRNDKIKLFVRRVFITDKFEHMMPNYLNFIQGIIDSDDLPLNVSRETLQQHKLLKVIKKKLVRKTLDMIKKLDKDVFDKFYKEFSTNLKIGVYDDASNRSRLTNLLRFRSSASDDLVSFSEYVDRMKVGQEHIYYITASSVQEAKESPFVERLTKKGYEVLYMTEPIDEFFLPHVTEFNSKALKNVAKEGIQLDNTAKAKERKEKITNDYKPVIDYLQDKALNGLVEKVEISDRLTNSSCALIATSHGWSGNMHRIMTAQAMQKAEDPTKSYHANEKKIFEINPGHPLIKELKDKVADQPDSLETKNLALMLFETATLRSGFMLPNTAQFADRIERLMRMSYDIDLDAQPDDELEENEYVADSSASTQSEPVTDEEKEDMNQDKNDETNELNDEEKENQSDDYDDTDKSEESGESIKLATSHTEEL